MAWGIGMNLSWLVGNYFSFHSRQAARERKSPVPSSHPQWIGSMHNPVYFIIWGLKPRNQNQRSQPWKYIGSNPITDPKTTDIERKGPPTSTSFFSWAISTSMFFSAMSLCLCCNSRRLVSVSLSVLNANDNEVNLFWKGKSGIDYHIMGSECFWIRNWKDN